MQKLSPGQEIKRESPSILIQQEGVSLPVTKEVSGDTLRSKELRLGEHWKTKFSKKKVICGSPTEQERESPPIL